MVCETQRIQRSVGWAAVSRHGQIKLAMRTRLGRGLARHCAVIWLVRCRSLAGSICASMLLM